MDTCRNGRLRHNRRMNRWLQVGAWGLVAAIGGCDGRAPASHVGLPQDAPQLDAGGSERLEWHGRLACTDCDAIDTDLVLQRGGRANDYLLTESYLATDGGARFVEHGRWQRADALLRLQGDGGSVRTYALLPDGRLQSRDERGQPLPARGNDFLLPVAMAPAD